MTKPDAYRYTDPVTDPAWPQIDAAAGSDLFPNGWGAAPTERDQAAMDAAGRR